MAQREGSVYLYLFVVSCVLFITMTVLFFVGNAEKEELLQNLKVQETKRKTAEDDLRTVVGQLDIAKEVVAGSRAAEWNEIQQFRDYYMNEELKGKAEKAINTVLADLKETPRSYKFLVEPYADLPNLFQKLREAG